MNHLQIKNPKAFSEKKVSLNQAITILKQNGVQTDEDQAKVILDFLYLIAKTYSLTSNDKTGAT